MKSILFAVLLIFCADISSQNSELGLERNSEQHNKPKPEPICDRLIPKKLGTTNLEITPIVKLEKTNYNSSYPCDSSSVISQLSYSKCRDALFTCNGIVVKRNDESYDVIFGKSHKVEQIYLTNYTQISTFSNGNGDYVECGTIVGGKCHGDTLWGVGIYAVDDQEGCVCDGMNGVMALVRRIEIRGKCESRCSGGSSNIALPEPINNNGLSGRTIAI